MHIFLERKISSCWFWK